MVDEDADLLAYEARTSLASDQTDRLAESLNPIVECEDGFIWGEVEYFCLGKWVDEHGNEVPSEVQDRLNRSRRHSHGSNISAGVFYDDGTDEGAWAYPLHSIDIGIIEELRSFLKDCEGCEFILQDD